MDAKAVAEKGLKRARAIFLQDLEALPEEAFTKNFGGTSRTVADIVHEVNMVNDHAGHQIRGEEPFEWPEGYIKAPAEWQRKETVITAFERSSQKIVDTVESFTSEEMEAPLQTEDGETTRFDRFRFLTLHMWYHSGQLNFIQTILGDSGWHWS